MLLPKLSDDQLDKLSDIASDIAIVAFASVALPAILDRLDVSIMATGFLSAVSFWIFSLLILKVK